MRYILTRIDGLPLVIHDELIEYFESNEIDSDETYIKFKDGNSVVVRESCAEVRERLVRDGVEIF